MAPLVSHFVRYAAQRIVASPRARELASTAAKGVSEEAKAIARSDDKARAAGRSFRKLLDSARGSARTPNDADQ